MMPEEEKKSGEEMSPAQLKAQAAAFRREIHEWTHQIDLDRKAIVEQSELCKGTESENRSLETMIEASRKHGLELREAVELGEAALKETRGIMAELEAEIEKIEREGRELTRQNLVRLTEFSFTRK